jgi:bifunctional DNase/RNase
MTEVQLIGVQFQQPTNQPVLMLRESSGDRYLPIWIGNPEAQAIILEQQGVEPPRPMTHDLITEMIDGLQAEVSKVTVTEMRDNTFYALIQLSTTGPDVEVDARPSDAIAVAVRTGAPIFAADDLLDENAIEFEHEPEDDEDMVEKFKEFLDQVTPEDFAD